MPATQLRGGTTARYEPAIEALAYQEHMPIEDVAQLYKRELALLTMGARITHFLPILTIRKVRDLLRQRRHTAHDPIAPVSQDITACAPV